METSIQNRKPGKIDAQQFQFTKSNPNVAIWSLNFGYKFNQAYR